MIVPVQILISDTVSPGVPYVLVVEEALLTEALMDAQVRFYNPNVDPTVGVKLQQTVSETAVFSDTFTLIDTTLPLAGTLLHQFDSVLLQDSRVVHTLTLTNNDLFDRLIYAVLSGWVDIRAQLSTYVGA